MLPALYNTYISVALGTRPTRPPIPDRLPILRVLG